MIMKSNKYYVLILALFIAIPALFMACKDDDDPVVTPVDKTALKTALDAANALFTAAVEGTSVGSYEVGSKAVFKTAIDAGQSIFTSTTATASDVSNAAVNLGKATEIFIGKKVAEIAPDKLIGFWKFDGDTKDASGNKHDGTLMKGHAFFGAGTPKLTKDRYGVADKAYHFEKGGNVEVPFASSLNPQKEMTISLWMKMDTVNWANNYMVSLNRWNGFKFQTQSTSRAFFTVHTADDKYIDKDNEMALDAAKWYHLAVSYKSGEMAFYVNGTQVKVYTDVAGDLGAVSNVNLTIGQDLPTSIYTTTSDKDPFYVNYGGYFRGDMDEVRMYNTVLTSTQIKSIYTAEAP
jgi:hypothetical protein